MNELRRLLTSVTYQLYANALLRTGLLAVSAGLLTATFRPASVWPAVAGALGMAVGAWHTGLLRPKRSQAMQLIHQSVQDAEFSLPLLDKRDLNIAEQLQLDRLNERIHQARVPGVLWRNAGAYAAGLLCALIIYYARPWLPKSGPSLRQRSALSALLPARKPKPETPPAFESAVVRVQPPAYTRLPERDSRDLNVATVVGSVLRWRVRFSRAERSRVQLVNSRGQALPFRQTDDGFTYQDRLLTSGIYAIKAFWKSAAGRDSLVYQSDFYRLEALPDLPPRIDIASKELYRFHHLRDPKTMTISARVSDDFSVARAFIVATVARGSGENVKFREVKLPLDPTNFREARLSKTLDLNALNFAPGDELYYYWAAMDNRQPEPNFTKSDTYFVVYKDTTQADEGELATMAVNSMPEYFRSQRQIIIDTEKLIASRKRMTGPAGVSHTFKSTSNEIGFDQKALRLRYGQFLGEEFEMTIGHAEPTDDAGNPLAGFMHDHDKGEGEHELHDDHEHEHDHAHGGIGPSNDTDPLAALMEQYVHSHDNAETNTFHEQSTRSLLKMALENMWQSELHLRLYEPEKALPYQQKALDYLKRSQQKARSYVRKTGFDPPPIKEAETRLTGELKNLNTNRNRQRRIDPQRTAALAADVLGYLDLPVLDNRQRYVVQQLGTALATDVVTSSLRNWSVLAGLQKLAGGRPLTVSEKEQLKTKLYGLLPPSARSGSAYQPDATLRKAFWRRL